MEIVEGKTIQGKAIAEELLELLKGQIHQLSRKLGRKISLMGISCCEAEDCVSYVRSQQRLAERLGIAYRYYQVNPSQEALNDAVVMANRDDRIDGVILYRPFPEGIDVFNALRLLSKSKDVEGLSPENVFGMFFRQEATIFPPTARAVLRILDTVGVDLYGKDVVVVGEGPVVGRPLSLMLAQRQATVTVCHLPTYERGHLSKYLLQAEIIITAVGKPAVIKADWIPDGAVVIDVGVSAVGGRIVGDVEFERALDKVSLITPVPGGVGPVTTAMLMENLVLLVNQRLSGGRYANR